MKIKYLFFLGLLGFIVTIDYILEQNIGEHQEKYNQIIHKTVQQSVLSQQTNILAMELVHGSQDQKRSIQNKLYQSVDLLRQQQKALALNNYSDLLGFIASDKIRAKYQEKSNAAESRLKKISTYLGHLMRMTQVYDYDRLTPDNPDYQKAMELKNIVYDTNQEIMAFFETLDEESLKIMQWTSIILLVLFWGLCAVMFYSLVIPDVRRQAEFVQKIDELTYRLRDQRHKAEQEELEKNRVINEILIALQTPIISVRQLLERLSKKQSDLIEHYKSIDYLTRHIAALKQIVQVDSNHSVVSLMTQDSSLVVKRFEKIGLELSLANNVPFTLDHQSFDGIVQTDMTYLNQILMGTLQLSFALANHKEGVKARLSTDEKDPTSYVIDIISYGSGLAQPDLEVLFDPYRFQLNAQDHTTPAGLSLVRRLCGLLLGKITVNSLLNKDFRVHITFPKRPDPQKLRAAS